MFRYILHRLILAILTLICLSIICFGIIQVFPGGYIEQTLNKIFYTSKQIDTVDAVDKEKLLDMYRFDKPLMIQYWNWLTRIVSGDFGYSFYSHKPVIQEIGARIPLSLLFGLTGFFLAFMICVPLGMSKALNQSGFFCTLSDMIMYIGLSMPGFILGIILILIFNNSFFPEYYYNPQRDFTFLAGIFHIAVPIICYAITCFAVITTLMKTSLQNELKKMYIQSAIAKGFLFKEVIKRQVFRNALISFIPGLFGFFSIFFSGFILIEKVFNIPGIGLLGYNAIIEHDYPVIIGLVFIQSIFILISRFILNISLAFIDPRKRAR